MDTETQKLDGDDAPDTLETVKPELQESKSVDTEIEPIDYLAIIEQALDRPTQDKKGEQHDTQLPNRANTLRVK